MTVEGVANFLLNTNCTTLEVDGITYPGGALQRFHELIGKRYVAYMTEDGFRSDGWRQMLSIYIGRPLEPPSTGRDRATPTPSSTPTRSRRRPGRSPCSTSCPASSTGRPTATSCSSRASRSRSRSPSRPSRSRTSWSSSRRRWPRPARPGRGGGPRCGRAGPGRGREGRGQEDPGAGRRARSTGLPAAVRHRPRVEPVPALDQQPDQRGRRADHRSVDQLSPSAQISRLAGEIGTVGGCIT